MLTTNTYEEMLDDFYNCFGARCFFNVLEKYKPKILTKLDWPELNRHDNFTDNEMIGIILKGAREKEDMTQRMLGDEIGYKPPIINQMENGKRKVGYFEAKKIANILNIDYRLIYDA